MCGSLRTSETNYLNEAFSFYSAIRMRAYYSKASKEERYAKKIFFIWILSELDLARRIHYSFGPCDRKMEGIVRT